MDDIILQSEKRSAPTAKLETKENWVTGYAAVFNSEAVVRNQFRELFKPNAFKLRNTTYALYNHNMDNLLGSTDNKTLELEQDSKGLRFNLLLPDTQLGKDLKILIERGDLHGASVGWETARAKVIRDKKPMPLHEVYSVDLVEMSLTYAPVYSQTSVGMRSKMNMNRLRLILAEKIYI